MWMLTKINELNNQTPPIAVSSLSLEIFSQVTWHKHYLTIQQSSEASFLVAAYHKLCRRRYNFYSNRGLLTFCLGGPWRSNVLHIREQESLYKAHSTTAAEMLWCVRSARCCSFKLLIVETGYCDCGGGMLGLREANQLAHVWAAALLWFREFSSKLGGWVVGRVAQTAWDCVGAELVALYMFCL